MTAQTRKRLFLAAGALLLLALLVIGFLPSPVAVQAARVERGPLQVIVETQGETRVTHRYVVAAPGNAYLRRIEVEAGDLVEAGQVVARLEAPRSPLLDPRARLQAEGRVATAQGAVAQAEERARGAEAVSRQAAAESQRLARLAADDAATRQAAEIAAAEAEEAAAAAEAARAAVGAARGELAAAGAALAAFDEAVLPVGEVVRAPAAGRVLAVLRESAGPVAAGEPLVEVGDTERLELAADVLSQDAVRIQPGMRVLVDQWGGEEILEARVRRVEPEAFTRVSALGVEEKRVDVLAIPSPPLEGWSRLGAGYRVLARFVVWEEEDVLQVPTAALFRTESGWAVFAIDGRRAFLRHVTLGAQSGLTAQVTEGLVAGELVVVHPPAGLEDGARVQTH
jgi:HlyD family secretion protein